MQTGATAGNVAVMDASGQYVDSSTALTDLAVKPTGATAGNVAIMKASGLYIDSGTPLAKLATLTHLEGKENTIQGGTTNINKVIVGTETGWRWTSTTGDTYTE